MRYSFTMPGASAGPVTLSATVRYRRFDQHFIDFGLGKRSQQPVIEMASTKCRLAVGENAPVPAPASVNPEWMRWNNYGIALLDAQQFGLAKRAFEHVQAMRPDYADARTNVALALILWERYAEALPSLREALMLAPDNARALYYLALVERNEGQLPQAVADLEKVTAQFPRSRDAHRELGFSFYQQRNYDLARSEYETVQSIDPDDLSAHYNLSILYRRLGLKDKAREQAAYFADQKDDPTASTVALDYLRKHHEIAQESVPWHTHDLDGRGTERSSDVQEQNLPSQSIP